MDINSKDLKVKVLSAYIRTYVKFNKVDLEEYLGILDSVDLDDMILNLHGMPNPVPYIKSRVFLKEEPAAPVETVNVLYVVLSHLVSKSEKAFLMDKLRNADLGITQLYTVKENIYNYSTCLELHRSPRVMVARLVSVEKPYGIYKSPELGLSTEVLKSRKSSYVKFLKDFEKLWNDRGLTLLVANKQDIRTVI